MSTFHTVATRFRALLLLVLTLTLVLSVIRIAAAAGEEVRGTLDNWASAPSWSMSGSLSGTYIYSSDTIASCSAAQEFKFYKTDNWYSNGAAVTTFGSILSLDFAR